MWPSLTRQPLDSISQMPFIDAAELTGVPDEAHTTGTPSPDRSLAGPSIMHWMWYRLTRGRFLLHRRIDPRRW